MPTCKASYYGELYLRHIHRQGYPMEEERKAFNIAFYALNNNYRGRYMMDMVARFHSSLKKHVMLPWLKRIPALHKMYADVVADYKGKYENEVVPVQNAVIQQTAPVQRKEAVEMEEVTGRMRGEGPIEADEEEEIVILEWIGPKGRAVQVKEEKSGVFPVQSTVQQIVLNPKKEMAREETDDDLIFLGERRGGQETVEERMAQLERELQSAQRQLLEEKNISSGLMNQMLQDKERTIQILTTLRK